MARTVLTKHCGPCSHSCWIHDSKTQSVPLLRDANVPSRDALTIGWLSALLTVLPDLSSGVSSLAVVLPATVRAVGLVLMAIAAAVVLVAQRDMRDSWRVAVSRFGAGGAEPHRVRRIRRDALRHRAAGAQGRGALPPTRSRRTVSCVCSASRPVRAWSRAFCVATTLT